MITDKLLEEANTIDIELMNHTDKKIQFQWEEFMTELFDQSLSISLEKRQYLNQLSEDELYMMMNHGKKLLGT